MAAKEEGFDAAYLQSINNATTISMQAKGSEQKYHLYVRLPDNLEEGKRYPTVYLLDGGLTFPMLSPYYFLLSFLDELPDVILVGISYGSDDWRKGNNRSHDFTLPAAGRDHWGGAPAFSQFLQSQLIPRIEQDFPADPDKRILFGSSLGGQFGLYTATFNPGVFYAILANNPAIHENTHKYLDVSQLQKSEFNTRLYIGQAEFDGERFKKPMARWLTRWQKTPQAGWDLKVQPMANHNHVSSIPDTFRLGLKWVLR